LAGSDRKVKMSPMTTIRQLQQQPLLTNSIKNFSNVNFHGIGFFPEELPTTPVACIINLLRL
jgi:hypothetical protein